MDKLDQLWVRACKSKYPEARQNSILRRFYLTIPKNDALVANRLLNICQTYGLMNLVDLAEAMKPSNAWKWIQDARPFPWHSDNMHESNCDYAHRLRKVLTSRIRLSEVKKFPGLTSPRCFRD